MDSFLRRLKYYGIGFVIGLIFVLFFFQNRGCSWLPSNRVKNSVLDRVLVVSDAELKELDSRGISKKDVIDVLNDGEVIFNESKKKGNPQVYLIRYEHSGKELDFYFSLPKESFISELQISPVKASKVKNTTEGKGKVLRFPNEEHLLYVDSSSLLNCQQAELGLINTDIMYDLWKKSARIDFEKSQLMKTPKPEHYFEFRDSKGHVIGTRSVWYKTKINISHFDLPFETDCK
jgi:hypothetical protein